MTSSRRTTSGSATTRGTATSPARSGSGSPSTTRKTSGSCGSGVGLFEEATLALRATSGTAIDLTDAFADWLCGPDNASYAESYFESPELLDDAVLADFKQAVVDPDSLGADGAARPGQHGAGPVRGRVAVRVPEDLRSPPDGRGRTSGAGCWSSSPASTNKTTTDCSTRATAGTTTPSRSPPATWRPAHDEPRDLRERPAYPHAAQPGRRQSHERAVHPRNSRPCATNSRTSSATASTRRG